MKNIFKKQRGFTLVELLIVLGIIAIMVAISAAILSTTKQKRDVQTVAEKVKSVILESRMYVFARPKIIDDADLITIKIDNSSSPNTITFYKTGSSGADVLLSPPLVSDTGLSNKIAFNATYSIKINSDDSNIDNTYGQFSGDSKIVLCEKGSATNCYHLDINKYGGINVESGN